ncbi:hypothetical protein PR202_ga22410 [Eleusine coracana subsp. coracana]|uniref:F-box domain-containing protein n=1 Tax=Eleusine coracana subsp. coracana TaxID=191504 RepID=A0AAV5D322_ELECO|nr:hypothetical protein PR202_ga22410 [Eleusine coracana subsp. coracana]
MAGEPDRLSALPDSLLHTIMSYMKARQVVQTCVLSTRWKHLWRSVPCLDLDLGEFRDDEDSDSHNSRYKDWEHFEDFAINLMIRHNIALLESFRLHAYRVDGHAPHYARERSSTWVCRAIKYCAPDPGIQREGSRSNSWRMKRLYLCNILLDNRFARHVSSACHSLEDLELKKCRFELNTITSHSLKNLVLTNCEFNDLSDITSSTLKSLVIDNRLWTSDLLVINAPAIAYLRLSIDSRDFNCISINEMPSLVKASIHLRGYRGSVTESELGHNQFKLLCSVSNATCLELSNLETMVHSEDSTTFKEFRNLRNLLLDKCDLSDDFQTLVLFLLNSPNLEKLTLRCCKFSNDSKKKKGTPKPKKTSSSQCRSLDVQCVNLKLTEIIYKDDDVRQLVELLLRISGNLPKNHLKLRKVD